MGWLQSSPKVVCLVELKNVSLDNVATGSDHQIDLVSTFMAAHTSHRVQGPFPRIFRSHCGQMLPKVKEEKLAEFCISSVKRCLYGRWISLSFRKLRRWASSCGSMRMRSNPLVVLTWRLVESTSAERDGDYGWGIPRVAAAKSDWNLLPAAASASRKMPMHRLVRCWTLGWPHHLTTDSNPGSCPTANLLLCIWVASWCA